ncbi:MAG: hypothetical protein FWE66_03535, partial [Oscillospiraceae bacterium]|nr:hypothetical protein [Oscillospiraceae bacterium]
RNMKLKIHCLSPPILKFIKMISLRRGLSNSITRKNTPIRRKYRQPKNKTVFITSDTNPARRIFAVRSEGGIEDGGKEAVS